LARVGKNRQTGKNQDDVFHVIDPELLAGLLNSDE